MRQIAHIYLRRLGTRSHVLTELASSEKSL
jgi:hypothetical protein